MEDEKKDVPGAETEVLPRQDGEPETEGETKAEPEKVTEDAAQDAEDKAPEPEKVRHNSRRSAP